MNEEIISKIKEIAYENVNKKLKKEREETERKINSELAIVETVLKYIKNKLLFKKVGDSWWQDYKMVTEEMFLTDYSREPEHSWSKGIEIKYQREKNWDYFIKINGIYYYDVRYIIRNYEEDFNNLNRRLNRIREDFSKIEEIKQNLLEQEPKIKNLLEQYQEVEIEENEQC